MSTLIDGKKNLTFKTISDEISQSIQSFLSVQPINQQITQAFYDLTQNPLNYVNLHKFKTGSIGKDYEANFEQLTRLKKQLSSLANSPEKYQYLTQSIEVINQKIVLASEVIGEADQLSGESEKNQETLKQRNALSLLNGEKLPDSSESAQNIAAKEGAQLNKQAASFSKSLLTLQKQLYTDPLEHLLSSALREGYEAQLLVFRETVLPRFIEEFQKLRSVASASITIEHNAANEMLVTTTGKAPTHKEIYSIEEELNKIESDRMQTLDFINDIKRTLGTPIH